MFLLLLLLFLVLEIEFTTLHLPGWCWPLIYIPGPQASNFISPALAVGLRPTVGGTKTMNVQRTEPRASWRVYRDVNQKPEVSTNTGCPWQERSGADIDFLGWASRDTGWWTLTQDSGALSHPRCPCHHADLQDWAAPSPASRSWLSGPEGSEAPWACVLHQDYPAPG